MSKYFFIKNSSNDLIEKINILLVIHSSTIRCWLESIIMDQMNKYRLTHNVSKLRFANSAILKLDINVDGCAKLSLLYEGIEAKYISKNKFFTNQINHNKKPKSNQSKIYFEPIKLNMDQIKLFGPDLNQKNYSIYICRHSQAAHNIDKNNKIQDTLLTPNGINHTHMMGLILKQDLNNQKINYFFSSNLKRSRETIAYIGPYLKFDIRKIIVIPCMHDLKASNDGYCYKKIKKNITIAGQMSCDINSNKILNNDICSNINKFDIDWDYYKQNVKLIDCAKTNLVQIIIDYIK
jgi:broad specificity phosphatase PhoE